MVEFLSVLLTFLDTFPSIMVIAGGSDKEYLDKNSTLSHVEILTSGSSATCHFDIQTAIGETGEGYEFESSANTEGGSGKIFCFFFDIQLKHWNLFVNECL